MAALSASVVSSTPLDIFPGGPAVGSKALWYWDGDAGRVVRLDVADGRVVATIPIGDPAAAPYGTPKTVAADGDIVWVTDPSKHSVARIDPKTNKVVGGIFLEAIINGTGASAAITPFGLAIDGGALWVSDFDQGVVIRVDPSSQDVTNVVTGLDHPEGIAVGFRLDLGRRAPDGQDRAHRSHDRNRHRWIDPTRNRRPAGVRDVRR